MRTPTSYRRGLLAYSRHHVDGLLSQLKIMSRSSTYSMGAAISISRVDAFSPPDELIFD